MVDGGEEAEKLPRQALSLSLPPSSPASLPRHSPALRGELRESAQRLPPGSRHQLPLAGFPETWNRGWPAYLSPRSVGDTWVGPEAKPQQGLRQREPNWAELNPAGNESGLFLQA